MCLRIEALPDDPFYNFEMSRLNSRHFLLPHHYYYYYYHYYYYYYHHYYYYYHYY